MQSSLQRLSHAYAVATCSNVMRTDAEHDYYNKLAYRTLVRIRKMGYDVDEVGPRMIKVVLMEDGAIVGYAGERENDVKRIKAR